ncbi:MAG: FKBP-type peptidyl-prolyl cis-trans isomerase [Alphaproteobacteria bacterium]|nr:FKBP-type peptidyl-prolyl cis-trans isomerase [Alphaproteobacteria bacterium]
MFKNISVPFLFLALITFAIPQTAMAKGLEVKDVKVGEGAGAFRYSKVTVHYTGWLMDGTKFDSSKDRNKPFVFMIGAHQVIPGWDYGVQGMKVGGVRELVIPPKMAYGSQGAGPIPGNSTLKFKIELLGVDGPEFGNLNNEQLKAKISKGVKVIDIRRPEEWKQTGIVEGSILITAFNRRMKLESDFSDKLEKAVKKDEEFILICRTGNRSAVLANMLSRRAGYTKIQNVTDGIVDWIGQKNPVSSHKG